jgi:hypothetical protein
MKTETVYQIPAENIGTVRARIEALQKRAARICKKFALTDDTAISITVGEPWVRVTRRDLVSEEVRTVLYPVTVTGAAPRIAGWDFVAVLEHTVAGNLLKQVPGTELPEATLTAYRAAPSLCDHCTTRRRRTETFLVRSASGELKQIGRNCLADYLGHEDPEAIIEAAQFLADCGAFFGDEEGWGSGGSADVQAIEDFLPWVAMAIRDSGWTPKSKAQPEVGKFSTVAVANSLHADYRDRTNRQRDVEKPSAADCTLAKAAIEWCRTELANKPSKSDYEHNLVVICSIDVLRAKNEGIAARRSSARSARPRSTWVKLVNASPSPRRWSACSRSTPTTARSTFTSSAPRKVRSWCGRLARRCSIKGRCTRLKVRSKHTTIIKVRSKRRSPAAWRRRLRARRSPRETRA